VVAVENDEQRVLAALSRTPVAGTPTAKVAQPPSCFWLVHLPRVSKQQIRAIDVLLRSSNLSPDAASVETIANLHSVFSAGWRNINGA
jgi:hypothetical protein